jgi:hypothetical protein
MSLFLAIDSLPGAVAVGSDSSRPMRFALAQEQDKP